MSGFKSPALRVPAPSALTVHLPGTQVGPLEGLVDPMAREAAPSGVPNAVSMEQLARACIGQEADEALDLLRAPLGPWSPLWLADRPELVAAWQQGRPCWLLAEVQLQVEPSSVSGVPRIAALEAWASRNGVRLLRRVEVLQPLLAYRAALLPSLAEPARQELLAREAALHAGTHAALLIELAQGEAAPLRAVEVGEQRAEAMRALFEEIFGHVMSTAHWRWKYATGLGQAVALVDADNQVVAHYGGLTRPVWAFGERVMACQVCDVMVAPRARRSLARRGPMFNLAASFLESQIGWGLRHRIGFGFPSARHHGAADRLGLYEAVDRVVELSWSAWSGPLDTRLQALALCDGQLPPQARARIESLWTAMAADLRDRSVGERDGDWVQWRYLDRPEVQYELHWVLSRWLRRPLGLLVLRRREDALELIDLIGPVRAFGPLLQAARYLAHAAGLPQLRLWITASQRALFETADPHAPPSERELNIDVPACAHTPGPDPARFRARWFLMAGDADFT